MHETPNATEIAALKRRLRERDNEVELLKLTVRRLQLQLLKQRRAQYGRSSEQLGQLALLQAAVTGSPAQPAPAQAANDPQVRRAASRQRGAHLPRETQTHLPPVTEAQHDAAGNACGCTACGGRLRRIGEDISEQIEWVPAYAKVIRHVRPKLACVRCATIFQAAAPSRPIPRAAAGAGLLAHVLVSKFSDHLPLYRLSGIYRRHGLDLDRATLANWVAGSAELLAPLAAALSRHVLAAAKVHADDTPVPVLDPGRGQTKTGRLWVYVRDDRPAGSREPPAAWYQYSPDRRGERPAAHLAGFSGVLQADAYAGFTRLYEAGRIVEAACWAHARRHFYDVHVSQGKLPDSVAAQALARIGALYAVEAAIRGQPPDERRRYRQAHALPLLQELHDWLQAVAGSVSRRSDLARAIGYVLARWPALTRYANDGRLEIDNNAAERALRGIALGRKNYLFQGDDRAGERAAALYSLIETAKLNGVNPQAYLHEVLARIAEHPINRIEELLPWRLMPRGYDAPLTQQAA